MAKNKDHKKEDAPVVDSNTTDETQLELNASEDEATVVEDAPVVLEVSDEVKLNPKSMYAIIGIKSDKHIKEGKEYHVGGNVAQILIKKGLVKLKD